ncbi:hypothetical protein SFB34_14415, partial [Legionella pneumophila]|nr:hypothetical protein [Legionella pneumophila]
MQLLSSTDRLGQAALLLTVIALAFTALPASLVTSKESAVPDTATTLLCCTGLVILICGWLVTVTSTFTVLVLSPAIGIVVGPSCVPEAKVIVQLAPIARLAPHVVLCTLMLLPPGMVATTFSAATGEPALL